MFAACVRIFIVVTQHCFKTRNGFPYFAVMIILISVVIQIYLVVCHSLPHLAVLTILLSAVIHVYWVVCHSLPYLAVLTNVIKQNLVLCEIIETAVIPIVLPNFSMLKKLFHHLYFYLCSGSETCCMSVQSENVQHRTTNPRVLSHSIRYQSRGSLCTSLPDYRVMTHCVVTE